MVHCNKLLKILEEKQTNPFNAIFHQNTSMVTYNFGCLKPVSIRYRRPNTENKDAMFEA
jgi:hypothetical protein